MTKSGKLMILLGWSRNCLVCGGACAINPNRGISFPVPDHDRIADTDHAIMGWPGPL